jgi:HEAT repeat protein
MPGVKQKQPKVEKLPEGVEKLIQQDPDAIKAVLEALKKKGHKHTTEEDLRWVVGLLWHDPGVREAAQDFLTSRAMEGHGYKGLLSNIVSAAVENCYHEDDNVRSTALKLLTEIVDKDSIQTKGDKLTGEQVEEITKAAKSNLQKGPLIIAYSLECLIALVEKFPEKTLAEINVGEIKKLTTHDYLSVRNAAEQLLTKIEIARENLGEFT